MIQREQSLDKNIVEWTEVYVALGGNIGDTASHFDAVIDRLCELPEIKELRISNYYVTTPVGNPDQRDFLNAACSFKTSLSALDLLHTLQSIETVMGRGPRQKDKQQDSQPRTIDLDLLFFGNITSNTPELQLPHPRWSQRLFVLKPLSDLTDLLSVPQENGSIVKVNLKDLIATFTNPNREIVTIYKP